MTHLKELTNSKWFNKLPRHLQITLVIIMLVIAGLGIWAHAGFPASPENKCTSIVTGVEVDHNGGDGMVTTGKPPCFKDSHFHDNNGGGLIEK